MYTWCNQELTNRIALLMDTHRAPLMAILLQSALRKKAVTKLPSKRREKARNSMPTALRLVPTTIMLITVTMKLIITVSSRRMLLMTIHGDHRMLMVTVHTADLRLDTTHHPMSPMESTTIHTIMRKESGTIVATNFVRRKDLDETDEEILSAHDLPITILITRWDALLPRVAKHLLVLRPLLAIC